MIASRAWNWSASITIVSNVTSHSTVAATRSPRHGYGIQVSACAHARSAAPSTAGQITGTATSAGHTASHRVASHRIIIAAEPYSIGQPTSAAFVTGSVNLRAG